MGQSKADSQRSRDKTDCLQSNSVPIQGTCLSHGSPVFNTLCVCESSLDSPINSSFLPWLVWAGSQASVGGQLTQLLCGFHTDARIHACSVSGHQKIQLGLHNNHTSVLLGEEGHRTLWPGVTPDTFKTKQNKKPFSWLLCIFCTYILIFHYFEKFSSIFWKVSVFLY